MQKLTKQGSSWPTVLHPSYMLMATGLNSVHSHLLARQQLRPDDMCSLAYSQNPWELTRRQFPPAPLCQCSVLQGEKDTVQPSISTTNSCISSQKVTWHASSSHFLFWCHLLPKIVTITLIIIFILHKHFLNIQVNELIYHYSLPIVLSFIQD